MKRMLSMALSMIVCMMLGTGSLMAAASGHFTLVEGRVDVLKKGAEAVVPAHVGDKVHVGDIVRTKSKSRAQIELSDQSQLNLAESTRMEIRRFSFSGGAEPKRDGLLHLFRGRLRSIVHHNEADKSFNFQVETPTAVAAVRGTDLSAFVKSDALTIVAVRQGRVQVSNQNGATVFITSNQYTQVFGKLPPTTPTLMTPAMKNQLFSKLSEGKSNSGTGGNGSKGSGAGSGTASGESGGGSGSTGESGTTSSGGESSGGGSDGGSGLPDLPEAPTVTGGSGGDAGSVNGLSVNGGATGTSSSNSQQPVNTTPTAPVTPVTPPITSSQPAILTAPVTITVNF